MKNLQSIGGRNATRMGRQILKIIFDDNFLQNYSWVGTAEKKAFRGCCTEIQKVVLLGIQKNFEDFIQHRFKMFICDYIKHAKFRI